jgi:hypothetical protein
VRFRRYPPARRLVTKQHTTAFTVSSVWRLTGLMSNQTWRRGSPTQPVRSNSNT